MMDQVQGIAAHVDHAESGIHEGTLDLIGPFDVVVVFRGPALPMLPLRSTAQVRMCPAGIGDVVLDSVVDARTELDGARSYGFRLADQRQVRRAVARQIAQLLDQVRGGPQDAPLVVRSPRIPMPPGTARLTAGAAGPRTGLPARLLDLSATGVAVLLEANADRVLAHVAEPGLELHLQGWDEPRTVPVRVRHRAVWNGGLRYGLELQGVAGEVGEDPLAAVRDWVEQHLHATS